MTAFVAKPIKVEAFQYGTDPQPKWYLEAVRKRTFKVSPNKGAIIAKTESGQFNIYDARTFNALFETVVEAKDLNKDGIISPREKAIASETKAKKKAPKPKAETTE